MGDDLTKDFEQGATGSIWIGDTEVGEAFKEVPNFPPLPEGKAPLELGGSGVIKFKLKNKRKKKYGYRKKNRRKELRKKRLFKRFIKGALRVGNGAGTIKRKGDCIEETLTTKIRCKGFTICIGDPYKAREIIANDVFNTETTRRAKYCLKSLFSRSLV